MHRKEAEELLEDFFDQAYNIPVIFSASDYSYSISMGDITQEVDVKHLLEEVKQKERERSLISKLKNLKGKHNYDYPALIDYEQDQKEDLSTIWNQVLGKEAIDAKLDMDPIQGLIVVPEETGKIVDVKATFRQLPQQWEGLRSS